jgi:thiamine-monophosphate kinase
MGLVDADAVVGRGGASDGDLLVVSGDLGAAYMGLQILEREKSVFQAAPTAQPELHGFEYLLERQLKPEARVDIVRELAELGVKPTSMIDVSDGLASEVMHLGTASQVGFKVYEDKLPVDAKVYETAREFNLDPTLCMLSGGEDYELLFTIKQGDFENIRNHPKLSVIGHAVEAADAFTLVTKNGPEVPLKAQGWDSFQSGNKTE